MSNKPIRDYRKFSGMGDSFVGNGLGVGRKTNPWPFTPDIRKPASHVGVILALGRKAAPFILMVVDYIAVILARYCALLIRTSISPGGFPFLSPIRNLNLELFFLIMPAFYIGLIFYEGLYTKRLPFWQSTEKLFKICCFATGFVIGILYFEGAVKNVSRIFIGASLVLTFVFLATSRYMTKKLLVALGIWRKPIVIIGAGKEVDMLAKAFDDEPGMGYQIVGLISESPLVHSAGHRYPVIGNFENLEQSIKDSGVAEVVIAIPDLEREKLLELAGRVRPLVKELAIIPDLHGLPISNLGVNAFFNQKVLMLRVRNNLLDRTNAVFKRFFDLFFGVIIFILSAPFMAVLALFIRNDSPGPVLHKGERLGKNGRKFKCYKFRTMYVNETQILQVHLAKNAAARSEWDRFAKLKSYDPRVTRVGRWMRKFSLDELPQIFNVLKGEMSLVGPRPYLPREQEQMGVYQETILETLPGITGLWQVRGRNDIEFEGRLNLDVWYVQNWSFWLDLTLMMKTFGVVFKRKGAY